MKHHLLTDRAIVAALLLAHVPGLLDAKQKTDDDADEDPAPGR